MAQGRLANDTFEQKYLVSQRQRIAVQEVDFDLRGASLVDQRIDLDFHRFAIVVNRLDQRVEFVQRINTEWLARRFGAPRAANGRFERKVRVGVGLDQVELHLRRHDRLPALLPIEVEHMAQYVTRRYVDRCAVVKKTIMDNNGRRLGGPRHQSYCVRVGTQFDVLIGVADNIGIGIGTRHGLDKQ